MLRTSKYGSVKITGTDLVAAQGEVIEILEDAVFTTINEAGIITPITSHNVAGVQSAGERIFAHTKFTGVQLASGSVRIGGFRRRKKAGLTGAIKNAFALWLYGSPFHDQYITDKHGQQDRELLSGEIFPGRGYEGDGTNYITTTSDVVFADNVPWAVSCFVEWDIIAQSEAIFGNKFTASNHTRFYKDVDGTLYGLSNEAQDNIYWLITLPTVRHHILIQCDGSNSDNVELFIDGISKGLRTMVDSEIVIAEFMSAGSGLLKADGTMDDFRVYGRALQSAEIAALQTKEALGGELLWYPCEDASLLHTFDASGNENHGAKVSWDGVNHIEGAWQNLMNKYGYNEPGIGTDVIGNGTFDTDTVWAKGTGWTISGGKAVSVGASLSISQIAVVIGTVYKVTYTISDYVQGSVKCRVGFEWGAERGANGTYEEVITCSGNTTFYITGFTGNNELKIDNVTVEEYYDTEVPADMSGSTLFVGTSVMDTGKGVFTPITTNSVTNGTFDTDTDWDKEAGWTIAGGKAVAAATTGELTQSGILTVDKWYTVTYTVSDYVGGTFRIQVGNGVGATISANGTYVETIKCVTNTNFDINGLTAFTGKIDDITIVEQNIELMTIPGDNIAENDDGAFKCSYVGNGIGFSQTLRETGDINTDLTIGTSYKFRVKAKAIGTCAIVRDAVLIPITGTLTTEYVWHEHVFTATSATAHQFRMTAFSAGDIVFIDEWTLEEVGYFAATPSLDCLGGDLVYAGQADYHGISVDAACFQGDGAAYLSNSGTDKNFGKTHSIYFEVEGVTDDNTFELICSDGTRTNNSIYYYPTNKYLIYYAGTESVTFSLADTINDGNHHTIIIVRSGTSIECFIDGITSASGVRTLGSDVDFMFDRLCFATSAYYFAKLCNFKVFSTVKTPAQAIVDIPDLVWYPICEGAGLTAYDVSGNGYHLDGTSVDETNWGTQDAFHYLRDYGMSIVSDISVPALADKSAAADGSTLQYPQSSANVIPDTFFKLPENIAELIAADQEDRYLDIMDAGKGVFTPNTIDIITNGTFSEWSAGDPDNWIVEGDDINNYVEEHVNGARWVWDNDNPTVMKLHQDNFSAIGVWYVLTVEITDYISGGMIAYDGQSVQNLGTINSAGTHEFSFLSQTNDIYFYRLIGADADLVISSVSLIEQNVESWVTQGANTIENDNGAFKCTYVDNANGAQVDVRETKDVNTDLTVGVVYTAVIRAKANIAGQVKIIVWDGTAYTFSDFLGTSYEWIELTFTATSATACHIRGNQLGSGEIFWIDEYSVHESVLSTGNNVITDGEGFKWLDDNSDGYGNGWIKNSGTGAGSIVTGNGFVGNAQKFTHVNGTLSQLLYIYSGVLSGQTYQVTGKFRSDVTGWRLYLRGSAGAFSLDMGINTDDAVSFSYTVTAGASTNPWLAFYKLSGDASGYIEVDELELRPVIPTFFYEPLALGLAPVVVKTDDIPDYRYLTQYYNETNRKDLLLLEAGHSLDGGDHNKLLKFTKNTFSPSVFNGVLTSTGDGTGVSTITLTASANTELKLEGTAKFYSDAAGTQDESSTWTVIMGGARTRYIRCPSGTSNFWIKTNTITSWGAWVSGANAASLSGDISTLTALTHVDIAGSNTLWGNVALMTLLNYLRLDGNNGLSGSVTALILLTYLSVTGSNTLSGSIAALVLLTVLEVTGANTLYGSLDALTLLTWLNLTGNTTATGDVSLISAGLVYCVFVGSNQVVTYTSGADWSGLYAGSWIWIDPAVGYGLSSAEVDLLIIEAENTRVASRAINISLEGSNAARTSASDVAAAAIISDGGTVTTNP